MSKKLQYFSEMEKYEIINVNDGDRYNHLGNSDVIIDESGKLTKILLGGDNKISLFNNKVPSIEINWQNVKKIGRNTIIVDYDFESDK